MLLFKEVVAVAAAAGIVTIGLATAQAGDIKVVRQLANVAPVQAATPAEKAEVGQAAAERIVQVPACARKVKVVYAGYGERDRASCPTATN